jgi:uncharacterized protein (TIGR00255 family)
LTNSLKRGKVDFKINFKISENNFSSNLNHDVIKSYIKDLQKITTGVGTEFLKIAVTLPNSIENNRSDLDEKFTEKIKELIKKAVKELIDFRIQEGKSMELDLLNNINSIDNKIEKIKTYSPERIESVKRKIKQSLEELKVEFDKNRFEQELIYYLEKYDINEEVIRLENHLVFFKKIINESTVEKGKKLAFVGQEIGREINTIGSKSNHLLMQQTVVEMKNDLEKIKEQLLNVL